MTSQGAGTAWPSATPPPARPELSWDLTSVTELPGVRADLRRHLAERTRRDGLPAVDLLDRLVLAMDEMASNALRHGGGGVRAALASTTDSWLVLVTDGASTRGPTPAVGRDPSEGGLGLYLIAELATAHGWYTDAGCKHVWALLPR